MGIISLRLPEEMDNKLDEIKKETNRPKSYFIKKALEEYLFDVSLHQKALDRLNDASDNIISSESMGKEIS
ncbi:MAG TPA: ribbon-helix-helix domain-containing protein [bacterium]|nr:ribbon-helix-helix domain-containing protein [bacterium]